MKRLISAFFNSLSGLRHGFIHETAIRQEIIVFLISIPVALLMTTDPWQLLLLWGTILLILVVELLNTGIEQIANLITHEFRPEIKFAKDCGSAAVLLATILAIAVWCIVLYEQVL